MSSQVSSGGDDDDSNGSNNSSSNKDMEESTEEVLGGSREEVSLALLDGFIVEEEGQRERITVPIKTLPAIFGRSHQNDDPHFVGLGKKKALSRQHFSIYYRDAEGGTVETGDSSSSKLKYVPNKKYDKSKDKLKTKELPSRGFFVIECIGKNRILVDKERVEQGESVVLKSGSAISVHTYGLYFLLPTDAVSEEHTVESSSGTKTKKKRKSISHSTGPSAASANKKLKTTGPHSASELDHLSTDELLEMFFKAVNAGEWERRHQIIGTAIVHRAVLSAAEDPDIQRESLDGPGVARGDLMDWISHSEKYGPWVKSMLVSLVNRLMHAERALLLAFSHHLIFVLLFQTKMEARSYQASITKALLKTGYTRTTGAGRYVKVRDSWL